MSASLAIQKAVAAALADVAGLAGVFDGPPPDAAAPYAVIGPDVMGDWSTKTEIGHQHRLLVTIWDDRSGSSRLKGLLAAVEAQLRGLSGEVDGQAIVLSRLLRSSVSGPEAGWRAGQIEMQLFSRQL